MKHRIWIDDGKHNEAEDGEDFDAPSARDAVEAWAEQRYSALQHVDPGRLLVRTPRGVIESWDVSVRISFVTKYNHTSGPSLRDKLGIPPEISALPELGWDGRPVNHREGA